MGRTIYLVAETGELILFDDQDRHKDVDCLDILALHPDRLDADKIEAYDG